VQAMTRRVKEGRRNMVNWMFRFEKKSNEGTDHTPLGIGQKRKGQAENEIDLSRTK